MMNTRPKICVAFDLDDTLYKERDYVAEGRRNVAREMSKRSGIDEDLLMDVMLKSESSDINSDSPSNGQTAFDALHDFLQNTPAADATINEYLEIYRKTMPVLTLSDATVAALNGLKQAEVILGIITDGRHIGQWNKIKALDLEKFIDHNNIIVSEDIGYDKQSHHPFAELAGRVGAEYYIYVGDNLSKDFHYPRILGWTAVMLRDTEGLNIRPQFPDEVDEAYRPDLTIDNLNELIPLCQQLSSQA